MSLSLIVDKEWFMTCMDSYSNLCFARLQVLSRLLSFKFLHREIRSVMLSYYVPGMIWPCGVRVHGTQP